MGPICLNTEKYKTNYMQLSKTKIKAIRNNLIVEKIMKFSMFLKIESDGFNIVGSRR